MNPFYAAISAAIPLLLLGAGCIPTRWANRHVRFVRRGVVALTALALGLAVGVAWCLGMHGPLDVALVQWTWPVPLSLGVYVDSVTAVMLLLISFVGLLIARYAVRYLDGEATQGRFFRWMAFTLGAVLLLVVSRNLVMFTAAWMLTSFGLHQLLVHYPQREWAVWAARKKFLISRLGDCMLLAGLVLTFRHFGSSEYGEIFAAANALEASPQGGGPLMSLIGMLYVLGAMTKSAQFPFHSWLPDTMETPTPVSALMHAGVINAGGFLVIRLSPLVSLSHLALDVLAWVGAFTALFGGLVMLTQTSIKRSLAYSTIAQMGFMMLQCGLGAFSAALFHLVAHSLYKAHAFLSSGSVLESAARSQVASSPTGSVAYRLIMLPVAAAMALGLSAIAGWAPGIHSTAEPGALILGLIFFLALTQLMWSGLATGSWRLAIHAVLAGALVTAGFRAANGLKSWLDTGSPPHASLSLSAIDGVLDGVLLGLVCLAFVAVFALQATAGSLAHHPLVRSLYVHAMNGFYLDIPARRVTALAWGRTTAVP